MGSWNKIRLLVVSRFIVCSSNAFTPSNDSLKNHGADELVDEMFSLGAEVMALPMEEKLKYEQGDDGMSFG